MLVVALEAVPVALGRLVGAPEARHVDGHDAQPAVEQRTRDLAVEVRPGRLAVEANDRACVTRTFVDVVHPQAVDVEVVRLEVVARQVGEAFVGSPEHALQPILSALSSASSRTTTSAARRTSSVTRTPAWRP